MSGHIIQYLKYINIINDTTLYKCNWILSHIRNSIIITIIIICITTPTVSKAFGESAIGHVGYILVRAGPVFRLGSLYLDEEFKKKWQDEYTDYQRAKYLISGKNFYFALEIGTMLLTIIVLAYLRLQLLGNEIANDVCHFV
jgi:hypothetical protein